VTNRSLEDLGAHPNLSAAWVNVYHRLSRFASVIATCSEPRPPNTQSAPPAPLNREPCGFNRELSIIAKLIADRRLLERRLSDVWDSVYCRRGIFRGYEDKWTFVTSPGVPEYRPLPYRARLTRYRQLIRRWPSAFGRQSPNSAIILIAKHALWYRGEAAFLV
jgi:hypothetical protein